MLLFLTYSKQLRILPAVIVKGGHYNLEKRKNCRRSSAYHLLILDSIINNDDGLRRRCRGIGVGSAAAGRVIIVGW